MPKCKSPPRGLHRHWQAFFIRGAEMGLCGAGQQRCPLCSARAAMGGGWVAQLQDWPQRASHCPAIPWARKHLQSCPGKPWQPDSCVAQLSHCCRTVNNRNAQLERNFSSLSYSQRMLSTLAHVNYFTASCHKQLNVCFSRARRAKSLKLGLRDTQEDACPWAGLVQSKAEPSVSRTGWILQMGKLSHRLVQQH